MNQQFFIDFEFILFVIAFILSIYIGYKENFKKENLTLISILFFVLTVNSLDMFSFFGIAYVRENIFEIRNYAMLTEVGSYLLLFWALLKEKRYKVFLAFYLFSFLLIIVLTGQTIQPFQSNYPTYSFVFGSIGVLIGILLFFYEKLSGSNHENIFRNFWFWISVGLFIFLSTEIPLMSLLNYLLHKKDVVIEQVLPIMTAKQTISSFYYLMYLVGVLCRMKT